MTFILKVQSLLTVMTENPIDHYDAELWNENRSEMKGTCLNYETK